MGLSKWTLRPNSATYWLGNFGQALGISVSSTSAVEWRREPQGQGDYTRFHTWALTRGLTHRSDGFSEVGSPRLVSPLHFFSCQFFPIFSELSMVLVSLLTS